MLVLSSQIVNFAFIVTDCHEQLTVCLFTSQELMDDLLHISQASARSDFLERIFNFISALHLLFHLFLQKGAPHFLDHVVLLHFQFVGVLILVGCGFSNFLLPSDALHASLKSFFLIFD